MTVQIRAASMPLTAASRPGRGVFGVVNEGEEVGGAHAPQEQGGGGDELEAVSVASSARGQGLLRHRLVDKLVRSYIRPGLRGDARRHPHP
jgi:hypothetical protein